MGVFAQYYGVPWLSFRAVTWHEYHSGQKGYALEDFMLGGGGFHPNARGHKYEPSHSIFALNSCELIEHICDLRV